MNLYRIVKLGPMAYVAEDIRTGNRSRSVLSEQEAVIEIAGLALRNLMHS